MRRADLADLTAFVAVAAQPHDAALRGASWVPIAEPHDPERLAHRCRRAPARPASAGGRANLSGAGRPQGRAGASLRSPAPICDPFGWRGSDRPDLGAFFIDLPRRPA